MDAQEMQDLKLARRKPIKSNKEARKKIEDLLGKKSGSSEKLLQNATIDPIEWALKNYPSLTEEKIMEMIQQAGF